MNSSAAGSARSAPIRAGVLRPMRDEDLELVLSWRNLPEVRRNMFTTHAISWAEHEAWWQRVKGDPARRWFLYCDQGDPVGVVNYYDIGGEGNSAYWGFYLGPSEAMGGRNRLNIWLDLEREAAAYAFGTLGMDLLLCETMGFNHPVLRVHERFGFKRIREFERARDGSQENVVLMGLTKADFLAAYPLSPDRPPTEAQAGPAPWRIAFLGSANWDLVARDLPGHWPNPDGRRLAALSMPFGQYRTQLLDPGSPLRQSPPDYAVFCERFEDLMDDAFGAFGPSQRSFIEARLEAYIGVIRQARADLPGRFFVFDLAPVRPYSASLLDVPYEGDSQRGVVDALNRKLRDALAPLPDTQLVALSSMIESFGAGQADPGKYWLLGRMAYSGPFGKYLNARLAGALLAAQGRTARALVLDLDNTVWGGVIGDDGIEGIQVGADYPGNAFLAFQNAALALKERGIALAICSKNTEAIALDAFARHPAMKLKLDDFAARRINWDPKPANIAALAEELGLGISALCFVDDSPYERAEVRRALPGLIVPEMPADVSLWPAFLLSSPWFAYARLTPEDLKRARQYQVRARIQAEAVSFSNKEDFWRSLEMTLGFRRMGDLNRKRVVQLLAKTNQFNTTTRRHGETDLARLEGEGAEVFAVSLADKYSQDEIIGVVILGWPGGTDGSAEIESFLLSCRVLGRSVESGILGWICARARARGYARLRAPFIETPRNQPAAGVYPAHGFARGSDGVFILDLEKNPVAIPPWFKVTEKT